MDCERILTLKSLTIRQFAELIGKLVASEPGVSYAAIFCQSLELEKGLWLRISKGYFEAKITLSCAAKHDIQWWCDNIEVCNKPVYRGDPDIILQSDSSDYARGGVCGRLTTGGCWIGLDKQQHIN